jgi:outer membrane protein, multidrug efflux system
MRRLALLLAPALLALCLAACQTGPQTKPDLRLPAAYEGPKGTVVLAPQQLDRWWLQFNDPELNGLEAQALANSPDANTAAARLLEANAAKNSQIAKTFPQGEGQGTLSRQHESNLGGASDSLIPVGGTTDTESINLTVSWEVDLLGRLATQRKVAKAQYAEARFNIEGTLASLVANVADEYFVAKGLAIQLDDQRETARIEANLQDVAQRKAVLGLEATSDADRVAADLSQAQAQVKLLEAQLHDAQRQLLILVGRGIEPTAGLPIQAQTDDPPAIPAAVPGDLLQRRPDVREADAHLRAQIGLDRLGHLAVFPTLTILPGLGASHVVEPGVSFIADPVTLIPAQQSTSLGLWSLAAGLSIPVLDIPQLLYEAKADDARTQEAAIAYQQTVQTAFGEAENALVDLEASEQAVAVLTDGESRARRASDAAHKRYAMGLGDITAALSAEQAWRNTQSALTAQRVQALRHAVQTYKALGGGWAFAASSAHR